MNDPLLNERIRRSTMEMISHTPLIFPHTPVHDLNDTVQGALNHIFHPVKEALWEEGELQ